MQFSNPLRLGAVLVMTTALAGCLGGGGGGGGGTGGGGTGGGGGTPSGSFQQNFDRVTAKTPTSNMPTTLQATYAGRLKAEVTDTVNTVGEVEGDINLDVDWTDGQSANPFTGTVSNIEGTLTGGQSGAIAGTLTVDDSFGGAIQRTVTPAQQINGINIPETQVGALSVTLTGELTEGATVADTQVTLGGAFFGDQGEAALGPVVGGFNVAGSQNPAIFDGSIAGQYYIEAQ